MHFNNLPTNNSLPIKNSIGRKFSDRFMLSKDSLLLTSIKKTIRERKTISFSTFPAKIRYTMSNLHYTRVITARRVTSCGAHLRSLAFTPNPLETLPNTKILFLRLLPMHFDAISSLEAQKSETAYPIYLTKSQFKNKYKKLLLTL